MLSAARLTDFGRAEAFDGLVTDGARLYFVERKGGHWGLMQVSVAGGEPAPIPTPCPGVTLFGISPDRSELLVGSVTTGEQDVPVWALPLVASSPRRLGSVIAHDAAWSPDGQKLVYARDSEPYLGNADGAKSRSLRGSPAGRGRRAGRRTDVLSASPWKIPALAAAIRCGKFRPTGLVYAPSFPVGGR